jgi:hypothetical protein
MSESAVASADFASPPQSSVTGNVTDSNSSSNGDLDTVIFLAIHLQPDGKPQSPSTRTQDEQLASSPSL